MKQGRFASQAASSRTANPCPLPDDPAQLEEVRDLAAARGRPVLLLGSRRWERIQTARWPRSSGRRSGRGGSGTGGPWSTTWGGDPRVVA